jgi:hypothetical protein
VAGLLSWLSPPLKRVFSKEACQAEGEANVRKGYLQEPVRLIEERTALFSVLASLQKMTGSLCTRWDSRHARGGSPA